MKFRNLLSVLLALTMIAGLVPALALPASAATAPTKLWVASTDTNGIPVQIDLFKQKTGGTSYDPTYTYQLFLPGNVTSANCFLSWDGDGTVILNGTPYSSGACPVPDPSVGTTIYTFRDGDRTLASLNLVTYQGSAAVTPVFIEIDESQGTIAAMKSSKDNSCSGIIYIGGQQYTLSKMKGRGNATWDNAQDKKPYNITLESKIKFPGIDSDKPKSGPFLPRYSTAACSATAQAIILPMNLGSGRIPHPLMCG